MLSPLGVQYLAAYLKSNNIDCDIIDLTFTGWSEYEKQLQDKKPEYIGFSIATPIAEIGLKAINMAKKVLPNSITIIGGPHATVEAENLKSDIVVIGEGEKILLEIIQKNIKKGTFVGERIENLDNIPFPARDAINMNKYIEINSAIEVMASRGCPFNCLFCQPTQRRIFGNKIRMRSPDNVISEINELIKKYGRGYRIYFEDDTFGWNKEWLEKFCSMVKPLKIEWNCNTRVDMVDEERLRMMKESGCAFIYYGVESGSQRILNFMRKGITVEQIEKAFELTHKIGLFCHAFVIIGTPTETKEDLEATRSLIEKIHPDGLQVSIMTPLIGTDLDTFCKERNISNIRKLSDYHYCMNEYPIKLEHLTADDLKYYKEKMICTWKSQQIKNVSKYIKFLFHSKNKKIILRSITHAIDMRKSVW